VTFGYKDFSETYAAAEKKSGGSDLILVFGSFFLVSEYLAKFVNSCGNEYVTGFKATFGGGSCNYIGSSDFCTNVI
jgi:hypothetical protein